MKFYPVFIMFDGQWLKMSAENTHTEAMSTFVFAFDQDKLRHKGETYNMDLVDKCFILEVK